MLTRFMRAWRVFVRTITPAEMAATELAEAERALLEAQTAVEYAKTTVDYHEARIKRLRKYLTTQDKEAS